MAVAWPRTQCRRGRRRPALSHPSLSLAACGGRVSWEQSEPPLLRSVVRVLADEEERGSVPLFILFIFFFVLFWLGLTTHSTKTTNLISQPLILTRSLNDLLSTIHSQIRQGSILINLETNSKVENLFVFKK